jgi:hypothetical protein
MYEVTVTVTDDDGATRSDTLFVEVEAGEGPSVSLTGPTEPTVGTTGTYTATVSAGDQPVETVTWLINGKQTTQTSANTENETGWFRFGSTQSQKINVTVADEAGKTASDTVTVRPEGSSRIVPALDNRGGDNDRPDGSYNSRANGGEGAWIENEGLQSRQEAVANTMTGAERDMAVNSNELQTAADNMYTTGGSDDDGGNSNSSPSGDGWSGLTQT